MMIWLWSFFYLIVSIGDIESTNWNRESIRARGGDPNTAEKAWWGIMPMVMNVFGDRWWKVRALGGHAIWTWLVVTRAWPLGATDAIIIGTLAALTAFIAGVVVYNSRRRLGLTWMY